MGVVYGGYRPFETVFIDGVLGYGDLSFDMRRRTPTAGTMVFGQRGGSAWFGSLRAGIDRTSETIRWSAYGGLEVMNAELAAFTETGSATEALAFAAREVDSLQGLVGLRYAQEIAGREWSWTPGLRLEWRHEFDEAGLQTIRYADWLDGPAYVIDQEGWGRSELAVGLSLVLQG